MYIWLKNLKREYTEIQVFPCFAASQHIKMNLNAKKQTLCCTV